MFQACTSQTWVKCGSSLVIQSASCTISKYFPSSCRSLARIHNAFEINPRNPPSATVVNASTGGAFSNGATRVRPSWSRSRFNTCCVRETPSNSTPASRSRRIFFTRPVMAWAANPKPGTRNPKEFRTSDFSLRSLGRGQLAPVENDNPDQSQRSAQQQYNLRAGQTQLSPSDAAPGAQRIDG